MTESHSQCMQLIFSGIRFEWVNRSFPKQQYSNGKIVSETQWNGKEKKKKSTVQKQQVRSLGIHPENYLDINILSSLFWLYRYITSEKSDFAYVRHTERTGF